MLVLILALSVPAIAKTASDVEPVAAPEAAVEAGAEEPVETAYGEGVYMVTAVFNDDDTVELTYLDGNLIYDDFWGMDWGKDSFGFYNSIEGSEFFGMTVEEAMALLESRDFVVNVKEIPRFEPPAPEEEEAE